MHCVRDSSRDSFQFFTSVVSLFFILSWILNTKSNGANSREDDGVGGVVLDWRLCERRRHERHDRSRPKRDVLGSSKHAVHEASHESGVQAILQEGNVTLDKPPTGNFVARARSSPSARVTLVLAFCVLTCVCSYLGR